MSPNRRIPAQGRSRQTVERILDAAAQVAAERGYAATTNHIADAAGVSIGTIYQYFADKDAIFDALQARHVERLAARLIGRGPTAGGEEWIYWLISDLVRSGSDPEAVALWEASRVVPGMRARITALVDRLAADARIALGERRELVAQAVVVTALAVVHEIVLPNVTPARRRVAIDAVMAVAGTGTGLVERPR